MKPEEIKHNCKECAEWSKLFTDWSKENVKRSKEFIERSKDYAKSCQCGENGK